MIGRFQPFHLGHLSLVKYILERHDELIIAVASAQFNYLLKDPFTAGERIWMIHESLKEEHIPLDRCYIVALTNDENNARWYAHLKAYTPRFDTVYTGNEYVAMLLKDESIDVRSPTLFNREEYNASRIREHMLAGNEWRHLVPRAVARIIDEIGGVHRLKVIARAESRPQEW